MTTAILLFLALCLLVAWEVKQMNDHTREGDE